MHALLGSDVFWAILVTGNKLWPVSTFGRCSPPEYFLDVTLSNISRIANAELFSPGCIILYRVQVRSNEGCVSSCLQHD